MKYIMARQEINIFGTSFLDLLSGALAAVIILFIIIPKMTKEDVELLEKVKEIQEITTSIDDAIEKIKNSVPQEVFEQLSNELNGLKEDINRLNDRIAELENGIREAADENRRLREELENANTASERLKQEVAGLRQQLEEANERSKVANTVEKTMGVFARFGILCRWTETDADVDLGVQRFEPDPEQCWRMYPSKKWGILGEDVRERRAGDEERFELFYVPEIYPGEYTAWVNIYEASIAQSATVSCVLIFHPGKPDERRIELDPFTISKGPNKCFVTFRLSDSGFNIISHREPLWGSGRVIK